MFKPKVGGGICLLKGDQNPGQHVGKIFRLGGHALALPPADRPSQTGVNLTGVLRFRQDLVELPTDGVLTHGQQQGDEIREGFARSPLPAAHV